MPHPVVLDTDIGTDIDDAYALILAAVSPELDLRAVTTVNNDTLLRARIAKKLLSLVGRDEIPVAIGEGESLLGRESRGWLGHEGEGIDLTGVECLDLYESHPADRILAREAERAAAVGTPATIVTIGAMTNLALALCRYPESLAKVGRIVSMAGNFGGFGEECACGEHNVACDPVAVQRVLDSGLPLTLVTLNVTQQTAMTADHVDQLERIGGPLSETLVGMHRAWFAQIKRDHSPMHDALAVALLLQPDLAEVIPARAYVDLHPPNSGVVVFNDPADEKPNCHVTVSANAQQFHAKFFDRIFAEAKRTAIR